jgi:hypothetical protein
MSRPMHIHILPNSPNAVATSKTSSFADVHRAPVHRSNVHPNPTKNGGLMKLMMYTRYTAPAAIDMPLYIAIFA